MKNLKKIQKFLVLVLMLIMVINTFTITGKATNESQIDVDILVRINDHIALTLPGYLRSSNLYTLNVTVSEPLLINDWNEDVNEYKKYICFVIDNETIIGKLTMAECDGEIISSFDTVNLDEVNKVFNKKIPVTFGTLNDCLMMQSGSESILLYGLYDDSNVLNDIPSYNDVSLITEIETKTFRAAPATRIGSTQLNVPFTRNAGDSDGDGLCWAACIASKVRYHYNNATYIRGYEIEPLTGAKSVYSLIKSYYGGEPKGMEPYIKYGYDFFSINTIGTGSLSTQGVENILGQGKPIHIGVDSSSGRHGILICGVDFTLTNGTYKIMDPNVHDAYVYSYVDQNAIFDGKKYKYLAPGGVVYDTWYETRY